MEQLLVGTEAEYARIGLKMAESVYIFDALAFEYQRD
jgi:hypothetical protein